MPRMHVVRVTPTVSTSPAYSANDQVGGIQTVSLPTDANALNINLRHVHVVDKGKQSAALTLFYFDDLPTVTSVDNGACDISDAEMVAKCVAFQLIPNTYSAVSGNSIGTTGDNSSGHIIKPVGTGSIYVVAMTTGTPTYASTSDLTFVYSFEIY